jgi:hypothetical protein
MDFSACLIHHPTQLLLSHFLPGPENDLGPKVNDAYFGKSSPERWWLRILFVL